MTEEGAPSNRLQEAMAKLVWWMGRAEARATVLGAAGKELSPVEENLLRTIIANGPVRMSDLASWQAVDKSTITPQARRLENGGLVKRAHDPADGRAVLLTATARGRRVCQRMDASAVALISKALQDWSTEDKETLARLFGQFTEDLTGLVSR